MEPSRTAVHMCYGYSKNIAEKRATPVYAEAVALLASTSADEITLEYAQPGHQPELLEHAGDTARSSGCSTSTPRRRSRRSTTSLARASAAVDLLGPDRARLAPDCGMWFLPRDDGHGQGSRIEGAARVLRQRYPD